MQRQNIRCYKCRKSTHIQHFISRSLKNPNKHYYKCCPGGYWKWEYHLLAEIEKADEEARKKAEREAREKAEEEARKKAAEARIIRMKKAAKEAREKAKREEEQFQQQVNEEMPTVKDEFKHQLETLLSEYISPDETLPVKGELQYLRYSLNYENQPEHFSQLTKSHKHLFKWAVWYLNRELRSMVVDALRKKKESTHHVSRFLDLVKNLLIQLVQEPYKVPYYVKLFQLELKKAGTFSRWPMKRLSLIWNQVQTTTENWNQKNIHEKIRICVIYQLTHRTFHFGDETIETAQRRQDIVALIQSLHKHRNIHIVHKVNVRNELYIPRTTQIFNQESGNMDTVASKNEYVYSDVSNFIFLFWYPNVGNGACHLFKKLDIEISIQIKRINDLFRTHRQYLDKNATWGIQPYVRVNSSKQQFAKHVLDCNYNLENGTRLKEFLGYVSQKNHSNRNLPLIIYKDLLGILNEREAVSSLQQFQKRMKADAEHAKMVYIHLERDT